MDQNEQKPPEGIVTTPPSPTAPLPPTGGIVGDITKRLEGGSFAGEKKEVGVEEAKPKANEPIPFDINSLRPEQLQQLKQLLAITPDRAVQKKGNPVVTIRRYQDRFIIGINNAFNTLVKDEATNMTNEVMIIPVRFLGEDKLVNISYKDFMNSDQIKCEIVSRRSENADVVEGEIVSKETGRLVERRMTAIREWFTIKLPVGSTPETVEIEAKIANA